MHFIWKLRFFSKFTQGYQFLLFKVNYLSLKCILLEPVLFGQYLKELMINFQLCKNKTQHQISLELKREFSHPWFGQKYLQSQQLLKSEKP
jgi:hypothetical protein